MASPKTITTMIFPSLSLFCLVVFVLSLYAPMILFSRSLLLGSLAVGVIAALVSIGSSILRRQNKPAWWWASAYWSASCWPLASPSCSCSCMVPLRKTNPFIKTAGYRDP
jgi:hypothetical protein